MMRRRAQSLMEYAVLTACIVAALLAMQFYLKRAVQGRVKQTCDQMGDPYDAENVNAKTTTGLSATITTTSSLVSTGLADGAGGTMMGYKSRVEQSVGVETTQDETFGGS